MGKNVNIAVRTRIAPSPTGEDIHIGNLYTALINYAVAKKHHGKFVVRIEDTDRERYVEGAEDQILASMQAFGLIPDESPRVGGPFGPYRQSERLNTYHQYAEKLIESGHAEFSYYPKESAGKKKDYTEKDPLKIHVQESGQNKPKTIKEMIAKGDWVVRLIVPRDRQITFRDEIRGEITFDSNQISSQVLIKSDGFPTYHMGVVVDDYFMKISHIIRAEEWISSTPKHILLYESFGWELPVFVHLPILRNPDRSKLSKRKNPVWASWYLREGYLPEAVLNFLSLMGWSHPEEKEVFSLEEFIRLFDIKDIKPAAPIFDITKLTWMNQQYIQKMEALELEERINAFYKTTFDHILMQQIMPLIKTRMEKLKDFLPLAGHLFEEPTLLMQNKQEKHIAQDLRSTFENIVSWNEEAILAACKEVMQKHGIRMPVLYRLLTGNERGLPLPASLVILGKDKTVQRLSS